MPHNENNFDPIEAVAEPYSRLLAEKYQAIGYKVFPYYGSDAAFSTEFRSGNYVSYHAALSNIPVISPDALTLEQVLDFRRDEKMRKKLRDLRLWLVDALKVDDPKIAAELIEQRLDDYVWSLKKHGINTVKGTISEILNWKNPTMTGAAMAVGGVIGGPIGAAILGGLVIGAQVGVSLTEKLVEYEDIKRGKFREVAYIHEIQKQFGNS